MSPRSLGEVLAAQDPAAPALVSRDARLTYGELMALATRAAGALHELGVGHGDRVGLDRPIDEQWLALFYGAALRGAVAVPIVGGAQCEMVLRELPAGGGSPPATAAGPEDLLLIQRGVMLTHGSLLRNALATGERVGVTREDRLISLLPVSRLCGVVPAALTSLVYGACLVMLPNPQTALETVARERCTLAWGDDAAFGDLIDQAGSARAQLSLRGGWAAAGPDILRGIIEQLGAKHVCGAYALTEASGTVTVSDWRDPEALRVQGLATPLPELQLRTLDGEIQVRGWSLMRGYYNNPEASARAFTEDGWLRTGDLGELHPGGRLKRAQR